MMVSVAQLVERPVVVREVAGSSPVSHPNSSDGVDGRVRKTPNLVRLVRFGVFRCYCVEKLASRGGVGYRLAPGLDGTARHVFNRVVGVLCARRTRAANASDRRARAAFCQRRPSILPAPRGERENPAHAHGQARRGGGHHVNETGLEARILHRVVVVCDLARHWVNSVARDAKGGENLVLDLVRQLRVVR